MRPWVVLKFGGTSVSSRASWETIASVLRARLTNGERPLLVCSAVSQVSNRLEELNALETFGMSPAQFLVIPRVLAAIIMTPLLSLFATIVGVAGGYVVMAGKGYTLSYYINAATSMPDSIDLLQGVFKTGIFALLVAAIGCHYGMKTLSGPGAVGDSTTKSVVAGIVLVIVADAILGVVFYYIGI